MPRYSTRQRKLLLDYLSAHPHQLLSAGEIARDLREREVSLSAVYRNLAQLEAEGKAQKLPFPLSMSIGTVVTDPESALSFADYVKIADSRMYEEKVQKRAARK